MQKINRVYLYLLFMELLVAFDGDDAGRRMASHIAQYMERDESISCNDDDGSDACGGLSERSLVGDSFDFDDRISGVWRSENYDLITITTPAISADWLEDVELVRAGGYDGYVFLSRHSAESGVLALTCHSLGNFAEAKFGGNDREVAIPHPYMQMAYLRNILNGSREEKASVFSGFDITIEATHHGPSALAKPAIFVEIGTTPAQWTDDALCRAVADSVRDTLASGVVLDERPPVAVCFGGTHYPSKFTDELLGGRYALGTVVPKWAVGSLDDDLFSHIMQRNGVATSALLDWGGISSPDRKRLTDLLSTTNLDVRRV